MKYISGLVFITLIMAAATSCRSTKTIQTAISKKDTAVVVKVPVVDHRADSMTYIRTVWDTIQKNTIDFRTFNARIKVDFDRSDGKKVDFNAYVKLRKDSLLWISINAGFGLEAFRIKITPDSLIILDKLKKTAQFRSVNSLQEVIQIPLTFADLQNLLVGNPIFLDSNNINSYKKDDKYISLICLGTLFKHLLTVSKDDYTLQHSKLDDVDPVRARTADITYGDYQYKNGFRFSAYRKITVSEKQKLDLTLEYKQFDFNGDLNVPFNVPKNYKRN